MSIVATEKEQFAGVAE